jgi:hypothetical protein
VVTSPRVVDPGCAVEEPGLALRTRILLGLWRVEPRANAAAYLARYLHEDLREFV